MTAPKIKGHHQSMATHGAKPTAEDLLTMKFLQTSPYMLWDYWTQVEVTWGDEIGYIDIVLRDGAGKYSVVEVKSSLKQVDEAIGQILRYGLLFSKARGLDEANVQRLIVCSEFYSSHIEVCKRLGITLLSV